MKLYIFITLLISNLFFSQKTYEQLIDEKIKILENKFPSNISEEKEIIELSNELYYMSKKSGNKKGMLKSLTRLALINKDKLDTDKTIKLASEGQILAKELKQYDEYSYLLFIKGTALLRAGNISDSRVFFARSLKVANLIEDKDLIHINKLSTYQSLAEYSADLTAENKSIYKDSILYFMKMSFNESLQLSKKNNRRNFNIGQSARLLGSYYYYYDNNSILGKKYFDIAEKHLINEYDKRPLIILYEQKGYNNFLEGNKESAIQNYNKALSLAEKTHYTFAFARIYEDLIDYYKKSGDTKKELYYLYKSKKLNDSLSAINKKALITENKSEIYSITEQKQLNKKIFLSIIVCVILFSLLLYYFYKKKRYKLYSDKEKELQDTEVGIKKIQQNKISLLIEMIKRNDKEFISVFQLEFPEFYNKLIQFSELTHTDIEFCCYFKLNIQTKEIALYKKASIGSVDSRKYRIRKKIGLPPETNLYKWINTI